MTARWDTARLGGGHGRGHGRRPHLLDVGDDLGEGEDADEDGEEGKPSAQKLRAQGEARHRHDGIGPDDGDDHADGPGEGP